jgi:mono/diheme cytochrome c family protein
MRERLTFFLFLFGSLGAVLFIAVRLSKSPVPVPSSPPKFLSQAGLPADLQTLETLKSGKLMFLTSCAKCHGNFGEGAVAKHGTGGPSLIDAEWRNGSGTYPEILAIVRHGVPGTWMMGWSDKMNDQDLKVLAAYVRVLPYLTPPALKK